MKTYGIVLITCGSVIAGIMILRCVCKFGGRKIMKTVTYIPNAASQRNPDLERGQPNKNNGGITILAGAAAGLATAAVVTNLGNDDTGGGGGCGGGEGGDSGGGCGGGGCGGGGCGGGCGG
ncbi:acanthoscurrin-1-like [Benincasa hispida]|uniref:acanthoscurrin-1-like n=1 Tax=Benincasa hispida TaxID=102211 RepID=UPI0019017090|nr:acanthoscurrin-1-like [Benincasa hispida]